MYIFNVFKHRIINNINITKCNNRKNVNSFSIICFCHKSNGNATLFSNKKVCILCAFYQQVCILCASLLDI